MNEVLEEIANGQLFPSTTYYHQQDVKKRKKNEKLIIKKPNPSIWVSDKILKKMDIMQDVNPGNDQQMFKIIEALDEAHSKLNNITSNYFRSTINKIETTPIIKDSGCAEDAKKQVINCLSENPRLPLNCSKQIKLFLQSIKNSTCSYKCNVLTEQL